uniref:Uncharacterized protein n=1 Tax=Acrobeloides nanus TaxID=290746 RepID=A0A914CH32_9BILA
MKIKCQAKCEVVDEQECPLQKCIGNNCSSNITKKDGCVFCDGAWQTEKTDMMVCRSGELLKKSCKDNEWCTSQGECKAQCERVDPNDGTITTNILASKNASTPILLKDEKSLTGKILTIFVIIASILFFIILGVCWYYRNRMKRYFNKNRVRDSQAMEIYLRRVASPATPNMSSIRLITLNQLIIDNKKLGEGEFGAVYALLSKSSIQQQICVTTSNL